MENEDYCQALADRIVFYGIKSNEVIQFAKYRFGKSWRDLVSVVQQAKKEATGRDSGALFDGIAMAVHEILEVDTNIPIYEFEKRLYLVRDIENTIC